MESESAALVSRILWNRVNAADVLRVAASTADFFAGLKRSFLRSSILRKSEMFSSSVCKESPLVPLGSASMPEPGGTPDEAALAFPLDILSSSIRVVPPEDSLPRRWLKELLYLEIGVGFGEPEAEDGRIGCSSPVFLPAEAGIVGGGILRGSPKLEDVMVRLEVVRGDTPSGGSTSDGDADNGGALKGCIDIEGRLATAPLLSPTTRPTGPTFAAESTLRGGDADEGEALPMSRTARNVDMGLAPVIGPTWWNVERLP